MKKKVARVCNVEVTGDKKYRPFVEEAVCKFLEYIDVYYRFGFVKSVKVYVHFEEEKKND